MAQGYKPGQPDGYRWSKGPGKDCKTKKSAAADWILRQSVPARWLLLALVFISALQKTLLKCTIIIFNKSHYTLMHPYLGGRLILTSSCTTSLPIQTHPLHPPPHSLSLSCTSGSDKYPNLLLPMIPHLHSLLLCRILLLLKSYDKSNENNKDNSKDNQTEDDRQASISVPCLNIQYRNRSLCLLIAHISPSLFYRNRSLCLLIAHIFPSLFYGNRIGYSIPMFAGFVILFISTLIFAFGSSYYVLFVARGLQGIGSSCSSVSGMGMLAERYPDDKERGNAMGIALGGLALGVLIGPPFGGLMYQYVNKAAPFLILAILALGDGLLQLLVLKPAVKKQEEEAATLMELIRDPYIIISAGAITFANMGIGILEPSLPLWMMDTMNSSTVETGSAFLPASVSYLLGTNLFGPLGHKIGRWLSSLIGLVIIGLCLMWIPMAKNINGLICPNAGLGFAIGMVDSSMMPELANLVDKRHYAVYGSVYSIGDIAFCLGFAIGPALSGYLVKTMGFAYMLYGCAFINFLYAPLMYFLKCPPSKCEETQTLIGDQSSVRYMTYKANSSETN
ncbi:unnamed protein product, partial [Meganyctiphanes norvegica]